MDRIIGIIMILVFASMCFVLLGHLTEKNRKLEQEIEEREKTEEKIIMSRQRYQAIFENSILGITITDKEGIILQVNDKWLSMTGYSREEVCNKSIMNFIAEDNKNADTELIGKLMEDRLEGYELERKYLRRDGGIFWGQLFMTTIYDQDNGDRVKLGMVQDITNRKLEEEVLKRSEQRFRKIIKEVALGISNTDESEEYSNYEDIIDEKNKLSLKLEDINLELEKMFKKELDENKRKEALIIYQARLAAMGEMIGNIAHQWRQPLNNLGLIISNIQEAYTYGELDGEYLNSSVQRCRDLITKMSETIDDFRDFSHPNSDKEVFSVGQKILTAIDLVEENLRFNNIEVEIKDDFKGNGFGYPNQYLQAVFNVINNSIDALNVIEKEGKKITIEISQKDKMIVVDFKDNGVGLSKDIEDKIFDIYFTTKDKTKGTGLGLYITKTIIENHMNGEIEIVDCDSGANIKISIPKAEEEVNG